MLASIVDIWAVVQLGLTMNPNAWHAWFQTVVYAGPWASAAFVFDARGFFMQPYVSVCVCVCT